MNYFSIALPVILSAIGAVVTAWRIKSVTPPVPRMWQIVLPPAVFLVLAAGLAVISVSVKGGPILSGASVDPRLYRGLDRGCFDVRYWKPHTELEFPKKDGCWVLPPTFGFFPDENGVRMEPPYPEYGFYGISTPVSSKTRISFTLRVEKLADTFVGIGLFQDNSPEIEKLLMCQVGWSVEVCAVDLMKISLLDGRPHEVVFDFQSPVFNIDVDGKLITVQLHAQEPNFVITTAKYGGDPVARVFISDLKFEEQ